MTTIAGQVNPTICNDKIYSDCSFYQFPKNKYVTNVEFKDCTFAGDIVDLSGRDVVFKDCDLEDCSFVGVEDFFGITFKDCKLPHFQIVPSTGSFIGWKKVRGNYILKLLIPASAKRTSSLVGRKCRANRVKVIGVEKTSGSKPVNPDRVKYHSLYRPKFSYYVGEYITESDYDDNPAVECTKGIHFFITKEEAVNYVL